MVPLRGGGVPSEFPTTKPVHVIWVFLPWDMSSAQSELLYITGRNTLPEDILFFTLRFVKKTGYAAGKMIIKKQVNFKMSAAVEINGDSVLLARGVGQTFSTSHALSRTPALSHVVLYGTSHGTWYITWYITESFSAQANTDCSNSTSNEAKSSRITCNEL